MAARSKPAKSDLTASIGSTLLWWGPAVLLIVLTINTEGWIRPVAWTAGLLWMAALCLWNLSRCGRVHCLFTGPFFLAMAATTVLVSFRTIWLGANTWRILGNAILIGAIVFCCVPEMLWGRYWARSRASS